MSDKVKASPMPAPAAARGAQGLQEVDLHASNLPARATPELEANFLSRLVFWWPNTLLRLGYSKYLELSDLWGLAPQDDSSAVLDRFEHELAEASVNPSGWKPFWRALRQLARRQIVKSGLLKLLNSTLQFIPPILLNFVLRFMEDRSNAPGAREYQTWVGWVFVIALPLLMCCRTLVENQVRHCRLCRRRCGARRGCRR